MYESCVKAGPEGCPLYENSTSLIAERVNKLIHKLNLSPLSFRNNQTGEYGVIRGSEVKMGLFVTLYTIYAHGKPFVDAIVALEGGDPQPFFDSDFSRRSLARKALKCSCPSPPFMRSSDMIHKVFEAVACGEGDIVDKNTEELETYFRDMAKTSQFSYLWLAQGYCSYVS